MSQRFDVPPSWPTPPAGWRPPPGWEPDASWGPAPEGWQFWVEDGSAADDASSPPGQASRRRHRRPLLLVLAPVAGVALLSVVVGAAAGDDDLDVGSGPGVSAVGSLMCLEGDPSCWTSRYGGNTEAAEDFLDGPDRGEGGLLEMSASPDGFVAAEVGMPVSMAGATANLAFDEMSSISGDCTVHLDPESLVAAIAHPGDEVTGYLIGNSVVETHDEIRIGNTLPDLEAAYPDLEVAEVDGGGFIAVTQPVMGWDEINDVSNERAMVFWLSQDEVIVLWAVGRTEYVLSPTLCPEA